MNIETYDRINAYHVLLGILSVIANQIQILLHANHPITYLSQNASNSVQQIYLKFKYPEFLLNAIKRCKKCDGTSYNNCTECYNGYYLDGSNCYLCKDKNCERCTKDGLGSCIKCKDIQEFNLPGICKQGITKTEQKAVVLEKNESNKSK